MPFWAFWQPEILQKASRRVAWCAHLLFHEPLSKVKKFHRLTILPCQCREIAMMTNITTNTRHQDAPSTATNSNSNNISNNKNNKNKNKQQGKKWQQHKNNNKNTRKETTKQGQSSIMLSFFNSCHHPSPCTPLDDHNASTGESNSSVAPLWFFPNLGVWPEIPRVAWEWSFASCCQSYYWTMLQIWCMMWLGM